MARSFEPDAVHKVGVVVKGDATRVIARINDFGNRVMFDLRSFYKKKDMEEFAPTAKGVSVDVNSLKRLRKAIDKAIEICEEEDLFDREGAPAKKKKETAKKAKPAAKKKKPEVKTKKKAKKPKHVDEDLEGADEE